MRSRGRKKILIGDWLVFVVGVALTAVCVRMAYQERGYIAFGGEWLALPIVLYIRAIAEDVIYDMRRRH